VSLVVVAVLTGWFIPAGGQVQAQDDAATFTQRWEEATANTPRFGPADGELVLDNTKPGFADSASAHVAVQDFAVHVDIERPTGPASTYWTAGVHFRLGQEPHFRFFVSSQNAWQFQAGVEDILDKGQTEGTDVDEADRNTIDLLAIGDTGYVAVNGVFLTTLPLAESVGPGDDSVIAGSAAPDATATYHDFTIWSLDTGLSASNRSIGTENPYQYDAALLKAFLVAVNNAPPDFGPDAGSLTFDASTISSARGLKSVQNSVLHIAFESPYTPTDTPWDVGVFMRLGQNPHFRFIIESTGHWMLTPGSGDPIQRGSIKNMHVEVGETTTLDIVAIDAVGYVAIDGIYLATLDLSAAVGPGEIDFGTSFFEENYVEAAVVPYKDFTVWSLDSDD
jgi:hypothetical protein